MKNNIMRFNNLLVFLFKIGKTVIRKLILCPKWNEVKL